MMRGSVGDAGEFLPMLNQRLGMLPMIPRSSRTCRQTRLIQTKILLADHINIHPPRLSRNHAITLSIAAQKWNINILPSRLIRNHSPDTSHSRSGQRQSLPMRTINSRARVPRPGNRDRRILRSLPTRLRIPRNLPCIWVLTIPMHREIALSVRVVAGAA